MASICAMLLQRLQCSWGVCNAARGTVQCFLGDCAMLLGRLINAARQTVQGCWADSAMLPGRLCKAARETDQCCGAECARLPGRLCNVQCCSLWT